jgi:putative tricarboxylic transport membrane protein
MESISTALSVVLSLDYLLAVVSGSVVGLIFGAIPGLTFSMALALMLPVTFALEPASAIALLLGTYIGGMTGGSVSAILLGIPGTPSAAATVLDGHPMSKRGQASVALGGALFASVFGGLFSLAVMVLVAGAVASLAINFGPAEIFALVLFGLSTICGLAERSLVRGLIGGVLGIMLMVVGLDAIDAVPRLTFGSTQLLQGVNLVVAMIGLFAVPEVLNAFRRAPAATAGAASKVQATLPTLSQLKANLGLMCRCAGIGTGIGAIPGTGGPIAAFLAYDHARRFSKKRANFGKGEFAGVLAPETANNAVTGGTMIPLLTLGIPGDPATAVILGGFLIHGITPGPMLFRTDLAQVQTIYLGFALAYLVVLLVQLYGIRLFVRVLQIPPHYLAVGIMVMCAIGSYAIRNSIFDVYLMVAMGLLGYLLNRLRIPVAPVVLGLVLGEILEASYRQALILSAGDFTIFVSSVPAVLFLGLTVLVIGFEVASSLRHRRQAMPKSEITPME